MYKVKFFLPFLSIGLTTACVFRSRFIEFVESKTCCGKSYPWGILIPVRSYWRAYRKLTVYKTNLLHSTYGTTISMLIRTVVFYTSFPIYIQLVRALHLSLRVKIASRRMRVIRDARNTVNTPGSPREIF